MEKNRAEQKKELVRTDRKRGRSERGTVKCRMSRVLAAAVFGTQLWDSSLPAFSETTEWEGITQMSASEQYAELDTSAVSLIVEEVYVEAGGYAQEGQSILKITDDSYQDALDYYAAAIIYAQNELTDAQMDYDIGMQEAEYALELARAEAEQAEFVKEQHLKELDDTIEKHEEIMTEIDGAIGEYEEGIAAGSYSSSSGYSGSSGSESSSSGKAGSSSSNEEEKESESGREQAAAPETEEEIPLDTEQSAESETQPGEEDENGIHSEGKTEATDPQPNAEEQLTALDEQIAAGRSRVSSLEEKVESINAEIEKKNEAYDEILKKMYQKLNLETDSFCGTGSVLLVKERDGNIEVAGEDVTEAEMLIDKEETEAEIEMKTGTKTGSADDEVIIPAETVVQETQADRTAEETDMAETRMTEMLLQEAPDTESASSDALPETQISDSESENTYAAETVLLFEDEQETSEKSMERAANSAQAAETSGTDTNVSSERKNAQNSADESETQDSEGETESEEEDTLDTLLTKLNEMEKVRATLYDQLEAAAKELETASAQLETLKEQKMELLESSQKDTVTETERTPSGEAGTEGTGTERTPSGEAGTEGTGTERTPSGEAGTGGTGTERAPSGENGTAGTGTERASAEAGSGSTASGNSGSSGQTMTGGNGYTAGGISSSKETESLFGDTYDLTSVENLLERTASSEEEAETILEELEEAAETVADQYAELIRNEKMTRLEIQYTCDTALIAGKLAEITYQQETEALENSLWEAENRVAELKEEEAKLETFTEGVVTAGYTGSIAAVNYAAGDELNGSIALYSVYDTNVVTVTLTVSQYEISEFHVGDTVSVQLSGYGTREGTVSAKSPEASESSSRTSVNYEVEITIENSNGRLSSGVSAAVSREVAEDE